MGVFRRTQQIEIARSPQDVFAYLTDPSKLATWQDAEDVEQLTDGALGVGTRLREVHNVFGRRRVEITEFVVYEPGERFEIRMIHGPPRDGRWDFEPSPTGTRLTFNPDRARDGPLAVARARDDPRNADRVSSLHRRLKRALETS
jgi:uncharacterized protein YndB with AHSA1/START domain